MPTTAKDAESDRVAVEQWLAIRKEAALTIDPETAEVMWKHGNTFDPYGVAPDLPAEYVCIGRLYFARSPGSEIWVFFGDLSDASRTALWETHKSVLGFPVGLLDC